MKEKIYTIPVRDAFKEDSECPFCNLYHKLEKESIEFVMGPSYMEDDVRAETNKTGFCKHHVQKLYNQKNRLGLALMLHTHQSKVKKDLEKLFNKNKASKSFIKKNTEVSPLKAYLDKIETDCYICNKVDNLMDRYIDTFFYLWKKDKDFIELVKDCKGFCNNHFGILYDESFNKLKNNTLDEFLNIIKDLYFVNTDRVQEDLDWFITKFDYRYDKEPWKNAKDALPRTIIKTNSVKNN
ncbi:MAG: DUF6062 family protein [Eubacteriales bacterium]